jgi:hypothetical protein
MAQSMPASASPERSKQLLAIALALEIFILGLVAVAPLAGISQTFSPLAREWPWLLWPARLVFGGLEVEGSRPPSLGWPSLALLAVLLVGASFLSALVIPICSRFPHSTRRHLALALGAAAVFGLTLVLLPSLPSDDLFSYILYGRISVIHHANPYIVLPSSFPEDPFLRLVFWQGTRSVYGPAWLLLSDGVTVLAQAFGGSLATCVLLFKLLGLSAHLANAFLIWLILGHIAPRRRLLGTLLYAWNPLCLLEFSASAHNDAVMLTFMLLGIYFLARGWEVPALVSFGLSISVKYVLLALLPFYLLLVMRKALARGDTIPRAALGVCWRTLVGAGVVALTLLPYWAGPETLGALLYSPPAQQLDNSLLEMVSWPLRSLEQALGFSHATAAAMTLTGLKALGLLAFLIVWLVQLGRVRGLESLLVAWAWVLLGYALIASGWYWPWYATWAVCLAALVADFSLAGEDAAPAASPVPLSGGAEVAVAALLLAGGSLTLYAFLPLYASPMYGLRALLALGPAAGFLLVCGWHSFRNCSWSAWKARYVEQSEA